MTENTEQKKSVRKTEKLGPRTKRNTSLKESSQRVKAKHKERSVPSFLELYPPEEQERIERATEAYVGAWMQQVWASFFPGEASFPIPESDKVLDFARARAKRRKR